MKRRTLSVLLSLVLALVFVFTLTACDGGGANEVTLDKNDLNLSDEEEDTLTVPTAKMPTGSSVANEEKWVEAFERTLELENYTFESSTTGELEAEGTVNKNYSPWSAKQENVSNIDVKYSAKSSSYGLVLYDAKNDKAYSESVLTGEQNSTLGSVEKKTKGSQTYKEYCELKEKKDDNKTYWKASYSKYDLKGTDGKVSEENYWSARKTGDFTSNPLGNLANLSFCKKKVDKIQDLTDPKDIADATPTSIYMLYDAFTYADGVYTAEIYKPTYITANSATSYVTDLVKYEVKVSINDRYVVGISYKVEKAEGTAKAEDGYNVTYTYSEDTVYAITAVKSTDVSNKVDKDITKALDEAKEIY